MDEATQARLTGIETRAKALGWDWGDFVDAVSALCCVLRLDTSDLNWHPAAERILSLYEPGPVAYTSIRSLHPETGEVNGTMLFCKDKELAAGAFKLVPVEVDDATV